MKNVRNATMRKKAARTSVSMPQEMMVSAQGTRVAGNFSTFSAYIQALVRKDLAEHGKKGAA